MVRSNASSSGRITMADLARLAGVSIPTVSRALRNIDSVLPETRARIQALAAEHGFVANAAAQALRGRASRKIAIVFDFQSAGLGRTSPDAFIFELLGDVAHALTIRDFEIALCPREPSTERYEQKFSEIGASGAIFLGQGGQHDLLQNLATRYPIVVWGALLPDSTYCIVGSDNFTGGRLVGEEFKAGARKSVLLVGNPETEQVRMRFGGFAVGFAGSGQNTVDTLPVGFSYEEAHRAVLESLKARPKPPDGIFAATDTLAMAAIRAIRETGLVVPDDVVVIGYNNIPQAQTFEPALTTIQEDDHRAGSLLVEKVMQIRDGVRASSVSLSVSLIRRLSSGGPAPDAPA
ncbi:substrate-binding domain-containing protein [Mesorhizobium sp. M0815]|uniref:LacI family DNA-binding transcriptional regulator n=1 Tax=Mesorhizobium sp. M0815 TaxID=2957005 RepID=UPI00333605EB